MNDHKCEFNKVHTKFMPDNKAEYYTSCKCGATTEPQSFIPQLQLVDIDPYEAVEIWLAKHHPDWESYSPKKLVQIIIDEY